MSSLSQILVSSSEFVLDTKQNRTGLSDLKENQILEAKVMKVLTEGRAQLLIKGEKIVAKTHVSLSENETIKLKVVKTGDTQVLKMVESEKPTARTSGVGELRALGRAGPYAKLTQIFTGQTAESQDPLSVKHMPPATGNTSEAVSFSGLKTAKDFFDHPFFKRLLPDSPVMNPQGKLSQAPLQIEAPNQAAQTPSSEMSLLKSFVSNKNISWEHKAASLILTRPGTPGGTQVPGPLEAGPAVSEKSFQRMETGLLNMLKKNSVPAKRLPLENSTGKASTVKQLATVTGQMTEKLAPEEKVLLNSVLKQNRLPWDVKMLSVLFAGEKSGPRDSSIQNIREALLSRLLTTNPEDTIGVEYRDVFQAKLPAGQVNLRMAQVHKQLEQLLELVSLNPEKTPDVESLKAMIKNSGLMWENKLQTLVESAGAGRFPVIEGAESLINQDIKALAMKLATALEGDDTEIGKTIKSFIDGLEKMQVLNQHASDESGRYLLPLPFFSESTLKFGQLFIDLDQKKETDTNGKERVIRVAFILEMSRLGHLRADFSIYKKSISGEFGVGTAEVKHIIDAALPVLKENMLEKEYTIKQIGCRVITPEVLAGTSLTDMVSDTGDGVLNIVI